MLTETITAWAMLVGHRCCNRRPDETWEARARHAQELGPAGYSPADLKGGGSSAKQMRAAGYSPGEAGANIAAEDGPVRGCPVACPLGTWGEGGNASALRQLVHGHGHRGRLRGRASARARGGLAQGNDTPPRRASRKPQTTPSSTV